MAPAVRCHPEMNIQDLMVQKIAEEFRQDTFDFLCGSIHGSGFPFFRWAMISFRASRIGTIAAAMNPPENPLL